MLKTNKKLLYKGNKISITIDYYAYLHNEFIKNLGLDKNKELLYSSEKVNKDKKDGKKSRPIIIIWSNKFSNKIIAVPETTKYKDPNKIPSFESPEWDEKNMKRYWKYDVLVFNSEDIKLYKNYVFKKIKKDVINEFLESWKGAHPHLKKSNKYLQLKINESEIEVRKNIIKNKYKEIKKLENANISLKQKPPL